MFQRNHMRAIITFTFFILTVLIAPAAQAAPIFQVGAEVGALALWPSADEPLRFGGVPTFITAGVLIPTGNGYFVRPHLSVGAKAPDGTILVREGVLVGKKLGDHLAVGAGPVLIEAFTPAGVKLNPGGFLAIICPGEQWSGYAGVGITRLGAIPSAGITFNL